MNKLKDNKEFVLDIVRKDVYALQGASERLQNNMELLEFLEKTKLDSNWFDYTKEWHKEKMEVLAELRSQEDKKLIEKSIINSIKTDKKVKF